MELRISSGQFKNRKLNVSENIRPVRERVKQAIFSILDDKVENAFVLDLFAGSGNLGLEALSKGASKCIFVDDNFDSVKCLIENTSKIFGETSEVDQDHSKFKIIKEDSTKFITNSHESFDLIFIDPPYEQQIHHIIKFLDQVLNDNGIAVYFYSSESENDIEKLNPKLKIINTREYGATKVDFIVKI